MTYFLSLIIHAFHMDVLIGVHRIHNLLYSQKSQKGFANH